MGRRKLEMGLIKNKKTRLRTFTNRKNGIMKKARELSKLCAVDIGVIIFGPDAEKLHVWPQESQKLNHTLQRYQSASQEERRKRAINVFSDRQKTHLIHNVKQEDDHIDRFSTAQLMELISALDTKLGIVQERINMMKRNQDSIHVEEVQPYGGENEERMMVNTSISMEPNAFQWEYQPDDHQYVEQRRAEELMMMMNGGSFYNLTNGYVGDCTGFMGMGIQGNHETYYLGQIENVNGNGGMWNPPPLTWYYAPFTQLQQQQLQPHLQQFEDDSQLPFC